MCNPNAIIDYFANLGFKFETLEEQGYEKEFKFLYSVQGTNWSYPTIYNWPTNELLIYREHQFSKKPVASPVFEGVLEKLEDLYDAKRLVLKQI